MKTLRFQRPRSRPTSRAWTIGIGALVVYFFANQTQVGWLYVMAALLAGVVVAAWWMNRGSLKGISGARAIGAAELYEGDVIDIALRLTQTGRVGAAQVRLTERCPFAPPDDRAWELPVFVPTLPARASVELAYTVTADLRGVYTFPLLHIETRAPFGLFGTIRTLDVPTPTVVYPEVRTLRQLALLDRQRAPVLPRPSAGLGYEVMGVRPYRAGDSPRHIHWRSTARTGQLISKEFADETNPGLTLALDCFAYPYADTIGKHTPFESAVKVAASLGDYARRRNLPLYLAANGLAAPSGAVAWTALLEWLARVQPEGHHVVSSALAGRALASAFVALILPYPDRAILPTIHDLRRRGAAVLAVVIDPASFPDAIALDLSADALAGDIGSDAVVVRYGDDWIAALADRRERVGA
ncbi:MAG: DUF58 domain-containing protein [Chloroflexota bacterium]|nr:DUF58 domain-containing protein [Chloroflexota bacterium]